MGQAVDTNATLGNTDLAAAGGFWAGASLPIGLAICLGLTGLFFAKRMNSMKLLTIGETMVLMPASVPEAAPESSRPPASRRRLCAAH
jgi:hypothetical protein